MLVAHKMLRSVSRIRDSVLINSAMDMRTLRLTVLFAAAAIIAAGAEPGVMRSFSAKADFALTTDPESEQWKGIEAVVADHGRFGETLTDARTEIRSRWTKKNLYFLFVSRYQTLYLQPNPSLAADSWGLWDFDVAEVFIGHDLQNIQRYKEFEVSPQGAWIDLDVDRLRKGKEVDAAWDSGFQSRTSIDKDHHIWICAIQIPWKAIDPRKIAAGNELRLNLYRIEGGPADRKFIAWQAVQSESYHTPEKFGRLRLVGR